MKQQPPKILIIMLGGGASGKTTTTNAFGVGQPIELREVVEVPTRKGLVEKRVVWTLYDNCGVAGNIHSTTDANNGPGAVLRAAGQCLAARDIIIIDGRIIVPSWVLNFNNHDNMHVIFLHFDLTAEQLLVRLQQRRGVTAEEVAYMLPTCEKQRRMAAGYAERLPPMTKHDYSLIRVSGAWTTEMIVEALDLVVESVLAPFGISFVEV